MIHNTQELPKNLKRYGFEYLLIAKDQRKALYAQCIEGKKIGYEVLMIKDQKKVSSNSYPKHEDFGSKAWSFRTEQAAMEFYQNLMPSHHGQTELPF